jgi:hypothetical protein
MWDKPHPPHRLPMMCNNLKVVKPPESIVFQFEIETTHIQLCSSLDQLFSFHYKFVMLTCCAKCEHSWHSGFVTLAPQNE